MDLLDRLLGHDHWATSCLLELSRDLSDAQLDQSFDIGFNTLRETFEHLIFNIEFWTTSMAGQPVTTEHKDGRSITELIEAHERFSAAFADVARRACAEQRLDELFTDFYDYHQSVGGTISQVIHHNEEHRTEILHILNRLGVPDIPEIDPQIWEHKTHII